MNIIKSIIIYVFIAVINFGCATKQSEYVLTQACTKEWFLKVEEKILTGDGQGHGPDPGSIEWRSVIEFKLGIRDDTQVPQLESSQWCQYINERFIKNR